MNVLLFSVGWECIARCAIGGCHSVIIHSQYKAPMGPSYLCGCGRAGIEQVMQSANCCVGCGVVC